MQLREIQEQFQNAITRFKHEPLPALPFLASGPPLTQEERLRVYATDWYERLRESLTEDFELLAREIGEEAFGLLLQDFLRAHPPSRFEMNGMGDALPEFFAARPEARQRPWLVDLARVERAYDQAGYAADADPGAFRALQNRAADGLDQVRIGLGPGVAVLASKWDLCSYWNLASVREPAPLLVPQRLIVYRVGYETLVESVDPLEASALAYLGAGVDLVEFLEQEFQGEAASGLVGRLGEWATRGWICLKN